VERWRVKTGTDRDAHLVNLKVAHGGQPACAPETLTAGQFWRGVARLGGFIGRTSDGAPGWQTLWVGWHRLQDRVWGFHVAQAP
jgi:hypothetical protein